MATIGDSRVTNDRTYGEDPKDPIEVRLPTGNQIFITLHMDESGGYIPSALFGDLLLDLCDGSAIKNIRQKASQNVCY